MGITHKKVVTGDQDPAFQVSKDEWNDIHDATGLDAATLEGSNKATVQDHAPKSHDKTYHTSPTLPDNDAHKTAATIDHPDQSVTMAKLIQEIQNLINGAVKKTGDTMTGNLYIIKDAPSLKLDATGQNNDAVLELCNTLGDPINFCAGYDAEELPFLYVTGGYMRMDEGDIELSHSTFGVILRSPNNTRWRIKVADDGTLSTEEI